MPCPYFHPTVAASLPVLPHPQRLSLGDSYAGRCTAAGITPDESMLHDCNLGYANCAHLPSDRSADAVRFCIKRDPKGLVTISYIFEASYLPVSHGTLTYDTNPGTWIESHSDAHIQRMAECCLESFRKDR
ncbi:MAG: hypothetical protein ACRD3E_13885 [Terriglobales bacterium]